MATVSCLFLIAAILVLLNARKEHRSATRLYWQARVERVKAQSQLSPEARRN